MNPIPFLYKGSTLTLVIDGKSKTLTKGTDINFEQVITALKKGDWNTVVELSNVRKAIIKASNNRVNIHEDGVVTLDGKVIKNALTNRMFTMLEEGFNVTPLMIFLENVNENPSESSRDELYLFLEATNLPITDDGHFLAYKMVGSDYLDIRTSTINNSIGQLVSMPRSEVNANRHETCSHGLHVCSESYLNEMYNGYSNYHMMIVKVNPKNVVSVPSDYNNSKMRVCEYLVIEEHKDWNKRLKPDFIGFNPPTLQPLSEEQESWIELASDAYEGELVIGNYNNETDDEKDNGITDEKIKTIHKVRSMGQQGFSKIAIGKVVNLSPRQVGRIISGEAWKDIV